LKLHAIREFTAVKTSKIIIFTCNWNAYSGLESAGRDHREYSADIRPIRVTCLGRLHPGIILKAFERGAAGVMMLGCPPDECHYDFGIRGVEEVFRLSQELLQLLGYRDRQLQFDCVAADDGETFVEKIHAFIAGLNGDSSKS
jgi:coenzyme F420-reducing hydrogenase delta subunit